MFLPFIIGLVCGGLGGVALARFAPEGLTRIQTLQRVFYEENLKKHIRTPRIQSWLQTGRFLKDLLWTELEQYFYGTCVHIPDTPYYRLTFTMENRLYRLLVRPVRGPRATEYLYSSTLEDGTFVSLTEEVVPHLYGVRSVVQPLTSKHLGFKYPVTRYSKNVGDYHMTTLGPNEPLSL